MKGLASVIMNYAKLVQERHKSIWLSVWSCHCAWSPRTLPKKEQRRRRRSLPLGGQHDRRYPILQHTQQHHHWRPAEQTEVQGFPKLSEQLLSPLWVNWTKNMRKKIFFISRKFKTFFYSSGVSLSKLNYWKINFWWKLGKMFPPRFSTLIKGEGHFDVCVERWFCEGVLLG